MVAWLTRIFGPAHLELAEEVVQDALVKALQQWPFSGIPDNPAGMALRCRPQRRARRAAARRALSATGPRRSSRELHVAGDTLAI